MKKILKTVLVILFVSCSFLSDASTGNVELIGTVVSGRTNERLESANVKILGSDIGTITNSKGDFGLNLKDGKYLIEISFLGYKTKEFEVILNKREIKNLGVITLEPDAINLKEITISASQNENKRNPVTLSTISRKDIRDMPGNKNFAETMRNVPSVYATSESGSYGDAKVNIRGFKQENINVMLNGIPLSGLYTGSMFWNNWTGLTDATYSIQVQKGIGASMISANSVGGTINIVTKPNNVEQGGDISLGFTDFGNKFVRLSFNSGEIGKGWTIGFSGSYTHGQGYVDATYLSSFGYMLNIGKKFNDRHSLMFTAIGSPDRHGQRSVKLSAAEVDQYGIKYNKNWGFYNGKINNISENFYHKPFFSLNHYFNISDKVLMTNTLYYSIGSGGGKWTESTGRRIIDFINPGGQIDWDAVYDFNINNDQTIGDGLTGFSRNIQSDYRAGHSWAGAKSVVDVTFNEHIKLNGGIHYQFFYSWQNEKITDLLGGKFWYEDYGKNSLAGLAGRNPVKGVGDFIRLNNGFYINHLSAFAQNSYDFEKVNFFVGGLLMTNIIQRWDKYNYVGEDINSDIVAGFGGNIKAGVNVKLGKYNNIYFNSGWNSKVPYDKYFFSGNNNNVTDNVKNEQAYIVEVGYALNMENTKVNLNGYYTYWKNRAIMSNAYKQLDDNQVRYMIQGLDAQHLGVELTISQRITNWLTASGFASIGNWKWKNDVSATIYDNYTYKPIDTINIYTNGLYVGDAPQTQIGINVNAKVAKAFEIYAEWRYNDRMFADFDPAKRTNPQDKQQSYKLPAYNIVDLYLSYNFRISKVYAKVWASCGNLFDEKYIERGDDGSAHDLNTFRGYWGAGRNFNFGLRVSW